MRIASRRDRRGRGDKPRTATHEVEFLRTLILLCVLHSPPRPLRSKINSRFIRPSPVSEPASAPRCSSSIPCNWVTSRRPCPAICTASASEPTSWPAPLTLPLSPMTEKDHKDLAYGLSLGVDWVALSFVQRAHDIAELKKLVAGRAAVMAKLEKPAAIEHLDEIIEQSDGIMVARGDLGVEMPPEAVPPLQKRILAACRVAGRPAIVATQMLDSMVHSPTPTRAEASDVDAGGNEAFELTQVVVDADAQRFLHLRFVRRARGEAPVLQQLIPAVDEHRHGMPRALVRVAKTRRQRRRDETRTVVGDEHRIGGRGHVERGIFECRDHAGIDLGVNAPIDPNHLLLG